MTRQTKAENLGDLITNLGHKPIKGSTADRLNQLETLVSEAGGVSEATVQAMVDTAIDENVEDLVTQKVDEKVQEGTLTDEDMADIFGD